MPLMHDDGVAGGMDNMDGTMDQSMNAPMQVDHLDVDDLFGEDVTLALPNVRAPSKELRQRMDDLRTRGCCQYCLPSRSWPLPHHRSSSR